MVSSIFWLDHKQINRLQLLWWSTCFLNQLIQTPHISHCRVQRCIISHLFSLFYYSIDLCVTETRDGDSLLRATSEVFFVCFFTFTDLQLNSEFKNVWAYDSQYRLQISPNSTQTLKLMTHNSFQTLKPMIQLLLILKF